MFLCGPEKQALVFGLTGPMTKRTHWVAVNDSTTDERVFALTYKLNERTVQTVNSFVGRSPAPAKTSLLSI